MNNVVVGVAAIVIGLLGFWQRDRITQLNRRWNKRLGKPGELASEVGPAKYFGTGAILMVPAGAATVIYSLITGQSGRATDESQALMIIIIAAVGFVVLGIVIAMMLYRRRSRLYRTFLA